MITKDNNFKVMRLFFDNPEKKFYLREIARATRLSAPGVLKIIKRLKSEGLLVSEKGKVVEDIFVNKNEKFLSLKRCYNLFMFFDSKLVKFLRDVYEEPEAIVAFGSYARGEDISTSDVDIAVVTKKRIEASITKFENALKRKINVYEIKLSECKPEFLNSLANGIVLYGNLEVVK
jgi:predicted nucleotidyltransferase